MSILNLVMLSWDGYVFQLKTKFIGEMKLAKMINIVEHI